MKRTGMLVLLAAMLLGAAPAAEEKLWDAARQGDLQAIKKIVAAGADVNATTRYGATALSFACDKGHLDVVRFLIEKGAEVNTEDTFYQVSPLGWALFNDHFDVVQALLEAGATGADQVLSVAVQKKNADLVRAALATGELDGDAVGKALAQARDAGGAEEIVSILESADVKPVERDAVEVPVETLESYVGHYRNTEIGLDVAVKLEDGKLVAQATGQPPLTLAPLEETRFEAVGFPIVFAFGGRGGIVERLLVEQGDQTFTFMPFTPGEEQAAAEPEEAPAAEPAAPGPVVRTAARNWPSFRGPGASGIADGQGAPASWDLETGENVLWKTPIPGIATSSPIIWGDRVFVSTAVSSQNDDTFRSGLYGDVDSVDDVSIHDFKVYALDRRTGKVVWEHTAARRPPEVKRHLKSSQANSTPVTDGKRVVVLFGSIGLLVCYDMNGKLLWETDLGILDGGWFYDRSYQWGHAASPVIYKNRVIVLADVQADSFVAAYNLKNGKEVWRTARDEVPQWGTPTLYLGKKGHELITNGTKVRGYDPATGEELWSLGPNSEVTVATPVVADDLFYVTAGYPPVRPIYVIRPGSRGDLTLEGDAGSSDAIVWSQDRGGTYIPTPIVYRDYLYTCANDGRLTCYKAKTGERVYRERVGGGGGSFSASPIAADGRLYFTDETGSVTVARAGAVYEELSRNDMDEITMSTPAISDGVLVIRTLRHVYGIGEKREEVSRR